MSWPMLLAEYPRPLLQSKLPLIVLVILERSGLTTESELREQIRVNQQSLSGSLLDLHRNQCIEFGRHSIRITDRGKTLIDKFKLQDGILESVLDHLSQAEPERAAYRTVLTNYRDTAFSQYLNSLCTLRIWQTISERIPLGSAGSKDEGVKMKTELYNQNILRALLLRDLRNWRIHSNPSTHIFDTLNDDFRNALTSDEPDLRMPGKASAGLRSAVRLLKVLKRKNTQEYSRLISKEEAPFVESLIVFDDFQSHWEKDVWYETWSDVSTRALSTQTVLSAFLGTLKANLPWTSGSMLVTIRRMTDLGSGNWWSGENRTETLTDFLPHLLIADSTEELATKSGISTDTVRALLRTIELKCNTLLSRQDPHLPDKDQDEQMSGDSSQEAAGEPT